MRSGHAKMAYFQIMRLTSPPLQDYCNGKNRHSYRKKLSKEKQEHEDLLEICGSYRFTFSDSVEQFRAGGEDHRCRLPGSSQGFTRTDQRNGKSVFEKSSCRTEAGGHAEKSLCDRSQGGGGSEGQERFFRASDPLRRSRYE